MGKPQKYSEDQLLEGVVKYSDYCKKKIKATELAKWCRDNVPSLEEVKDYHFKRNIKERDAKTGRIIERQKLSALRIDEINRSRSLRVGINSNLIFKASNIDVIFEQPISTQRNLISEAREMFDKLLNKNYHLERECEILKSINNNQKSSIEKVNSKTLDLQKTLTKLTKQINYLMKEVDLENRKNVLRQMGIDDEKIDLDTYVESLQQSKNEVLNIKKILLEEVKKSNNYDDYDNNINKELEKPTNFTKKIIDGINFD